MEMLQLRYFYDSAKSENFTLTAQKYDVPTTSVSAAIRRLEQELGCKLFDRSYNRIILNANGKRFQQALCIAFSDCTYISMYIIYAPHSLSIHLLMVIWVASMAWLL